MQQDLTPVDRAYVEGWVAGIQWFQDRFSKLCVQAGAEEIARAVLVVDAREHADAAIKRIGDNGRQALARENG